MELITFRALLTRVLHKESIKVQTETIHRINTTLELLGTETLSAESIALISMQVKSELKE